MSADGLLERGWAARRGSVDDATAGSFCFRALQFNTLADVLTGGDAFPFVAAEALAWPHRWRLLRAELERARPDLIGLQEVDTTRRDDWLTFLAGAGYVATHSCKRNGRDGPVLGYRRERFRCVHLERLSLADVAEAPPICRDHPQVRYHRL